MSTEDIGQVQMHASPYILSDHLWPTHDNTLTWSFNDATFSRAEDDREDDLGLTFRQDNGMRDVIRDAFDAWEAVCGVDFVEVADNPDADIRIGWTDERESDGPGGVLGYSRAWSWPASGERAKNVIVLDRADAGRSLDQHYDTVLHEIGHALGLRHSDVPNVVMSGGLNNDQGPTPYWGGVPGRDPLQPDDIDGAIRIWGPEADIFRFGPSHGHVTIGGYWGSGSSNKIDLSGFGARAPTWEQVSANLTAVGANVVLDLSDFGGGSITFLNTRLSDIDPSDFQGLSDGAQPPAPPPPDPDPEPPPPQGTEGDDRLDGTEDDDRIDGRGGDDRIRGHDGDDTLKGGSGDDTLDGGRGDDRLEGGAGEDRLEGGRGNDDLEGGPGDDTLIGGEGRDTLNGRSGTDEVSYAGSDAGVHVSLDSGRGRGGDAEGDRLSQVESVKGSRHGDTLEGGRQAEVLDGASGADSLSGGRGDDTLIGGSGDDTLAGGEGADDLRGGGGTDRVTYAEAQAGVSASLATPGTGGIASGDQISGVEQLVGSRHDDTLEGSGRDDLLLGGAGDDRLIGGAGSDTLTGGAGWDVFVADRGDARITDFTNGRDRIDISGLDLDTDDLAQVLEGARQQGGDVVVDLTQVGGGRLRLEDFNERDLDAADFIGAQEAPPPPEGHNPIFGTPNNERLVGTEGPDVMSGGGGYDVVVGRGGDDILIGGPGGSTLFGQAGADTFVFSGGQNWFMDFDAGEGDRIEGVGQNYFGAHGKLLQVGDHLAVYFGEDPWDAQGPGTVWMANTSMSDFETSWLG